MPTKLLFKCDNSKNKFLENPYHGPDGQVMRRIENPASDHLRHWGLFGADGILIDHDQYRTDLAERNNIELFHA